uniref:CUB domain-containing protein n=1 Tax=Hippocampus comes TaxID=109280 RepID=A0A3Q2Z7T6_HIPCM
MLHLLIKCLYPLTDDKCLTPPDVYRKEDNITVTPPGGVIHSPRFPNSYPRNLLLSWTLVSPPGSRIHLEFDGHFGLEEAENNVCSIVAPVCDVESTFSMLLGCRRQG